MCYTCFVRFNWFCRVLPGAVYSAGGLGNENLFVTLHFSRRVTVFKLVGSLFVQICHAVNRYLQSNTHRLESNPRGRYIVYSAEACSGIFNERGGGEGWYCFIIHDIMSCCCRTNRTHHPMKPLSQYVIKDAMITFWLDQYTIC